MFKIMLNLVDTLPRKAQYFAGEVKAQTICPYKVVRNLIFQQIVRVLASFLPHESGEEPMIEVLSMEIQELTVSERIMLAEALWDSVAN
tara:strand:+ start:1182 stop:1448 length:267 start_codon:yes stop_codon:yes gene_type:complete